MGTNLMSLMNRTGGGYSKFGAGTRMLLSAKDYIQDGLVAMWDGIENAGWGVHDANATKWTSLIYGEQANISTSSQGWSDNALEMLTRSGYVKTSINNTQFCTLFNNAVDARSYSCEFVYGMDDFGTNAGSGMNNQVRATGVFKGDVVYGYLNPRVTGSSSAVIFFTSNQSGIGWYWRNPNPHNSVVGKHSLSVAISPNSSSSVRIASVIYNDGNVIDSASVLPTTSLAEESVTFNNLKSTVVCIGARYGNAVVDRYFCSRYYNRTLTADEIAYNNLIDHVRYGIPIKSI